MAENGVPRGEATGQPFVASMAAKHVSRPGRRKAPRTQIRAAGDPPKCSGKLVDPSATSNLQNRSPRRPWSVVAIWSNLLIPGVRPRLREIEVSRGATGGACRREKSFLDITNLSSPAGISVGRRNGREWRPVRRGDRAAIRGKYGTDRLVQVSLSLSCPCGLCLSRPCPLLGLLISC